MFSCRLKELRNNKNISQKELATVMFVSQQTIAKWETDKATPNPDTLLRLANFFNITVDFLIGRTNFINSRESVIYPVVEKYKKLNTAGRNKVDEYINDLINSGNYSEEYSEENFPHEA